MLHSKALEEVNTFVCIGSVVYANGGTEADIKSCIRKAHPTEKYRASRTIGISTKLKLFCPNVKLVLFFVV